MLPAVRVIVPLHLEITPRGSIPVRLSADLLDLTHTKSASVESGRDRFNVEDR